MGHPIHRPNIDHPYFSQKNRITQQMEGLVITAGGLVAFGVWYNIFLPGHRSEVTAGEWRNW